MAKLALALLAAPAVAFVAPGQQAASKVVVKGDIGVDPGPIDPSGPFWDCLLYTSPSPRDKRQSRMPSSA